MLPMLPDNSISRIQATKTDILAYWSFTILCGRIFVASRIKRCPDHSNYIFLRILENKTDILAQTTANSQANKTEILVHILFTRLRYQLRCQQE